MYLKNITRLKKYIFSQVVKNFIQFKQKILIQRWWYIYISKFWSFLYIFIEEFKKEYLQYTGFGNKKTSDKVIYHRIKLTFFLCLFIYLFCVYDIYYTTFYNISLSLRIVFWLYTRQAKRFSILELFKQRKRQCRIVCLLNVSLQTVSDAICHFKELDNDRRRPGSGRKRNTSNNPKANKKRVKRNPTFSMRNIAREIRISDQQVQQMAKTELRLLPYKFQKVQLLTEENKLVQLQRCRKLLRRAASQRFFYPDEKLFTIQQTHNSQNDSIWSVDVSSTSAIVEHRQNPMSVMVWGEICTNWKTPLVFVDECVKINQKNVPAGDSRSCCTSVGQKRDNQGMSRITIPTWHPRTSYSTMDVNWS